MALTKAQKIPYAKSLRNFQRQAKERIRQFDVEQLRGHGLRQAQLAETFNQLNLLGGGGHGVDIGNVLQAGGGLKNRFNRVFKLGFERIHIHQVGGRICREGIGADKVDMLQGVADSGGSGHVFKP